jgi:heat shock protein HslJ
MKISFLLKTLGVLVLLLVIFYSALFIAYSLNTGTIPSSDRFAQDDANGSPNIYQPPTGQGPVGQDPVGHTPIDQSPVNPTPLPPPSGQKENKLLGRWAWVRTDMLNGSYILAPIGDKFILTFDRDGNVGSSTDCNGLGGNYVFNGEILSFGPFIQTLMYCEGSMESEYSKQLSLTSSYTIFGNELRLNLNRDYGVMTFKRVQ